MDTNSSTRQLIGAEYLENAFFTDKYFVVVDGSFFLEYPEFISAYWFFIFRTQVTETGNFVAKVSRDLQSAFIAEVCRVLGVLLSTLKVWKSWGVSKKLNFKLVSDCKSALY